MGLSFLQQLLTVAGLAFASGLLLGVAVLRGEIGGLRDGGAAALDAPRPGRRRRRKTVTWAQIVKSTTQALSELDPALKWVLVSLAAMLTISAVITRVLE